MAEHKTVEFENGNEYLVFDDGTVEELTAADRYFNELEDYGITVDRSAASSRAVYVAEDGQMLFGTQKEHTIFDIAEEVGVEVEKCWPSYTDGDDTDLNLYLKVHERAE
jgi:hypothetical protein